MNGTVDPRFTVETRADGTGVRGWPGRLADELRALVAAGYPPGLALAVVDQRGALLTAYGGFACVVDDSIPLERRTLFDLASLTKVVATVPLALVLEERGRWRLTDPVAAWVPEFPRPDTTLWNLLTHTSGLVPHRAFYVTCPTPAAVREAVCAEGRESRPGGEVIYSDLNFMLLGWAIERCAGAPLGVLFRREIARPLGMQRSRFRPQPRQRRLCAATELDGDQRTEPGLIWGIVHDGNAFALRGVAGHAGLFGPIDELAAFAGAFLNPVSHPVLSATSVTALSMRQAGRPPDVRSLGWRLDPEGWGDWPAGTYWHTGFTGTSILVAPARGLAVVLLMNGVHPKRRPEAQLEIRSRIHSIIAETCP
ncbi:MAG: serine hydrolase domain-containing protein [Candidatus Limnocylindrales bacterium]